MRAPEFWMRDTPAGRIYAALLSPLAAVYGASIRVRKTRAGPYRANARVICVGNLTVGGSGKTPVAIALAKLLETRGKVVFVSRGYGGRLQGPVAVDPSIHRARDVGDEPLLLARHASTIVARKRNEAARMADATGADFIVMDDGFQNFTVAKDISLIVIDAEAGFGNGKIIPAGPLREPVHAGLRRADAVVLTGGGTPAIPSFGGPIFRMSLLPEIPGLLRGRAIMAFAGIGRPAKFFAMLAHYGANLIGTASFSDHHMFTQREIAALRRRAEGAAALLVTTEKDYLRLDGAQRRGITAVPVSAIFDDSRGIEALFVPGVERELVS